MLSWQRLKKILKREFLQQKKRPKSLEFLLNLNFHALIEDNSGTNTKRRVEVKLRTLKEIIETKKVLIEKNLKLKEKLL